jgi:anaerobic nitric oxide reductase transcription regulator
VRLDAGAIAALKRYPWPGNVRELENLLSRVILVAAGSTKRGGAIVLAASHLGPDFSGSSRDQSLGRSPAVEEPVPAAGDLKEATRDFQRGLIRRALSEHQGNWAAAARSLGMHRSNFHHLATRLGLKAGKVPAARQARDL